MKRFKVFKILYYSFMIVIGIIFCFVLPSYNQLNTMTKRLKDDIKEENYGLLPSYFGAVYNENPIVNVENDKGARMVVFESVSYMRIDDNENYSYSDLIYMGFVINPVDYNYDDNVDGSGNKYNYRGIKVNDSATITIPDTSYFYLTDLNFFYFEISSADLEARNITKVNNIKILDNLGNPYIYNKEPLNNGFDNDSNFFKISTQYKEMVNESVYHNQMTIDGNVLYSESGSTFKAGTTIKYTPYGSPTLNLDCNTLNNLEFTNATKQDDGITYKLQAGKELEIKVNADTVISGFKFNYGNLSVRYGFDNSDSTYSETFKNEVYYYGIKENITDSKTIGIKYDVDDVNERYSTWKDEYAKLSDSGYKLADVSSIMKSARIKTIIQIVCYFLIVFIIGDFLVGKRHILAFFSRLFGKNKKGRQEDEVTISNEYEVNVVCQAHVPVGYKDKISVVYGKANGEKMLFELDYTHNYKMAKHYKNGEYEFLALDAKGLHLIKTNSKINVRGYRFELILSLAYDEIKPELQNNNPVEKPKAIDDTKENINDIQNENIALENTDIVQNENTILENTNTTENVNDVQENSSLKEQE